MGTLIRILKASFKPLLIVLLVFNLIAIYNLLETLAIFQQQINLKEEILLQEIQCLRKEIKTVDIPEIEKLKKANVLIENVTIKRCGSGTHIKIDKKSYILTCAHLIKENNNIINAKLDNGDTHPLQLLKKNKELDLALFKIWAVGDLPYLEISDEEPKEGSEVTVIGNPNAIVDVVTDGIISHIDDKGYTITNTIFFGSSGGCVIYKNRIIGVVTQFRIFFNPPVIANYGYAIKLSIIQEFLKGL